MCLLWLWLETAYFPPSHMWIKVQPWLESWEEKWRCKTWNVIQQNNCCHSLLTWTMLWPGPCSVAANGASLTHPPPRSASPPQSLWGLPGWVEVFANSIISRWLSPSSVTAFQPLIPSKYLLFWNNLSIFDLLSEHQKDPSAISSRDGRGKVSGLSALR